MVRRKGCRPVSRGAAPSLSGRVDPTGRGLEPCCRNGGEVASERPNDRIRKRSGRLDRRDACRGFRGRARRNDLAFAGGDRRDSGEHRQARHPAGARSSPRWCLEISLVVAVSQAATRVLRRRCCPNRPRRETLRANCSPGVSRPQTPSRTRSRSPTCPTWFASGQPPGRGPPAPPAADPRDPVLRMGCRGRRSHQSFPVWLDAGVALGR